MPIVVLGLEISAHTNRFLRLFGCLKATMAWEAQERLWTVWNFFEDGVEAVSQTGMVCEDIMGSFTFLFFFVLK